ncbi:MAG: hypothetical protein Kow00124_07850 [Anaerolineae bacterium]
MTAEPTAVARPNTPIPQTPEETEPPPPTPAEPPSTPDPFPGNGPWEITFEAADGLLLSGTLYGKTGPGIVLVPMYPGGQDGWAAFAEQAAEAGYRALTFDLRGHGSSEGPSDFEAAPQDILAALGYLQGLGAEPGVLMGPGEGGTAAILAAADVEKLAGLVAISSPRSREGLELSDADLARLDVPTLWLASRHDMTQDIEVLHDLAGSADKTLWIYEGSSLHGTYIFEGADGPDLSRRLFEFLSRVTAGP